MAARPYFHLIGAALRYAATPRTKHRDIEVSEVAGERHLPRVFNQPRQVFLESLPDWFIEQAQKDCAKFQAENAELLTKAGDDWQNGSDFWYTRNGHGVGFWDRGYPDDVADPLTEACKKYGEAYLCPEDIGQEA